MTGSTDNSIFYHEDSFCQVEVLPKENYNELIKEAESIKGFSDNSFDGVGYKDIVVRNNPYLELKQRKINPVELDAIISKYPLKKYTNITTGIKPGEIVSKNTIGYSEENTKIFYDYDHNVVNNLWLIYPTLGKVEVIVPILYEIGKKWDLLLMDWESSELINLSNKEEIENYINSE